MSDISNYLSFSSSKSIIRSISQISHSNIPSNDTLKLSDSLGSIYSVCYSNDNKRFITSGNDYKIKLWDIKILESNNIDVDINNYLLCTIETKPAQVNIVRFSRCNTYFITGDSMGAISLYRKTNNIPNEVFGSNIINIEDWARCAKVSLDIANLDIQDLSWSNDGRYIAASTLSNFVNVYSLSSNPLAFILVKKLECFQPSGISWTPNDSHLCCQRCDGTIQIWECASWKSNELTHPKIEFRQAYSKSVTFWRIDWNPTGECLAGILLVNRGFQEGAVLSYGAILFNNSFNATHFIPTNNIHHTTKFSPCLFKDNKSSSLHLVAIGSLSGSVTIWCSNSMKAVAIINGLLGCVTDISWSPTGDALLVALENMGILYIKINIASMNLVKSDTLNTLKKAVVSSFQLPENISTKPSTLDQIAVLPTRKRVVLTTDSSITDNISKEIATKKVCTDQSKSKESDKYEKPVINGISDKSSKVPEKSKEQSKVEAPKKAKEKEISKQQVESAMEIDEVKDGLDEEDDRLISFSNRPLKLAHSYLAPPDILPDEYVCYSVLSANEINSSVFSLRVGSREPSSVSKNCSSIRCFEEPSSKSHGSLLWQDELNLKVKLASISSKFAVIVLADQCVFVWNVLSGRRLMQSIVLPSGPSFMNICENRYLIATIYGELLVIDLEQCSVVLTCTIQSLIKGFNTKIIAAYLLPKNALDNYRIKIYLSDGAEYLYTSSFPLWKKLKPFSFDISKSLYFDLDSLLKIDGVSNLQNMQNVPMIEIEQSTLLHLEAELQNALLLTDVSSYKKWFTLYVEYLCSRIKASDLSSYLFKRLSDYSLEIIRPNSKKNSPPYLLNVDDKPFIQILLNSISRNPVLKDLFSKLNDYVFENRMQISH